MATLTLKITSFQRGILGDRAEKKFDHQGGTIGRASDNAFVLADPERFVSSYHGRIHCEGDDFYLTDISTNGIVHSRDGRPIGKDNSVSIVDGDVLTIGDYDITVEIARETSAVSDIKPDPLMDLPHSPVGNDIGSSGLSSPESAEPSPWSFPGGELKPEPEPFFGEVQPNQSSGIDSNFIPNDVSLDEPFSGSEPAASDLPAASDAGGGIPEDWNITTYPKAPSMAPKSPVKPEVVVAPPEPIPDPVPEPLSDPFVGEKPLRPAVKKPATTKKPATKAEPAFSSAPTNNDNDLLACFLRGAGVDSSAMEQIADQGAAMEQFGSMFRGVVEGLMQLLEARSKLKSEFRMSYTTIRPTENNPLKFSPNVEEALRTLFVDRRKAYLSPHEAITESIDDVRNHQIAMIKGMEAAFNDLMHRMRPETFQDKGDEGNTVKAALMSINKKTRCWDNYREFYDANYRNSDNAFEVMFGKEFSKVYEDQINQIKSTDF